MSKNMKLESGGGRSRILFQILELFVINSSCFVMKGWSCTLSWLYFNCRQTRKTERIKRIILKG